MSKLWSELRAKGIEPWDYEIAVKAGDGMPEHEAKSHVIMRWMKAGDFRPLLASIKKNGFLRGQELGLLVQMIEGDQLKFAGGRGRRPDPEADVRRMFNAETYEDFLKHYRINSDNLIDVIGDVSGVSEKSVRQAVTSSRKPKR